jgi:thioesterase domain-containing protein
MGGNLFHYYDLVRYLDTEQAVYGLQARGVYGAERPDHWLESIAAHCIESMRAVQASGPHLVAGFSSGGVVAYEMAQQLAAAGEELGLLALLDTHAPQATLRERLVRELTPRRGKAADPRWIQEFMYFLLLHSVNLDGLRELRTVGEAHRWAHWSYRPQPYAGPIELFMAQNAADRARADNLGWDRWAKGTIRIHHLLGSHGALVKAPIVEELAGRLQACIDSLELSDPTATLNRGHG